MPSDQQQFVASRDFRSVKRYAKTLAQGDLLTFLKNPDAFITNTPGPFFKAQHGDTTTVCVVTLDGQQYVVKRYNYRTGWHALKSQFRPSRARQSFFNALLLKQCQIASIEPVALLEKKWGPWRRESYLVYDYILGVRGQDYFAADSLAKPHWPVAVQAVTALANQLSKAGILHADFQHRNMIFVNNKPVLLDLDYMRQFPFGRFFSRRLYQKNLQHFILRMSDHEVVKQMFENF